MMNIDGIVCAAQAKRLSLNDVTLCAVSSSNLEATIRALETSLTHVDFAQAMLFTDADIGQQAHLLNPKIAVINIDRINSSEAYSRFILSGLIDHIKTSHCLIVQWDGHVIDPTLWRPEFLQYDYIGARWPQFVDGHDVGNGGFSLRSRRLMEKIRLEGFHNHHPEDVAIGRTNREFLEKHGLRFPKANIADQFSAERAGDAAKSFGYHGIFLMPKVLGTDQFWKLYRTLDDRSSARRDVIALSDGLRSGRKHVWRSLLLILHIAYDLVARAIR